MARSEFPKNCRKGRSGRIGHPNSEDEIVFLGTGGARYVIAKQLRATGGMLFRLGGSNVLVDPGPESLYRLLTYLPKFNPEKIDAIILTHKHIDQSADVNVYLDVMTRGGFNKHGILLAPQDAFGENGVIYNYLLDFLKERIIIKEKSTFEIDGLSFVFPIKHEHRVETYGFKLLYGGHTISYITDQVKEAFDEAGIEIPYPKRDIYIRREDLLS